MLTRRSVASCIILSLITCGIYTIYWWICINNDFAKKIKANANGAMVVILSLITCGIYFLVWSYQMGNVIEKAGGKNERVLYLVLSLFGFGLITLALMQAEENRLVENE